MKTIFWNVDTQYDFMRDDDSFRGALPVPGARSIESNLEKLTKYARVKGIQIVNTADWHTIQSREISTDPDYKSTFPSHCLQRTKGADYVPATQPNNPYLVDWQSSTLDEKALAAHIGDIVILKDASDVFAGNPNTDKVLNIVNPYYIVVYGVATNVCVDFAVRGLLDRQKAVYVVTDAIKEIPSLPLEETLQKWREKGAKLVSTRDLINDKII